MPENSGSRLICLPILLLIYRL